MNKDLGLRGVNLIRNRYTVDYIRIQTNKHTLRSDGFYRSKKMNKDTSLRQLKQMSKLTIQYFHFSNQL